MPSYSWIRVLSLSDRGASLFLFLAFSLLYGYFFQGGGWNQNSHFDTIRAITELGTVEINQFAGNTGDIAKSGGRIYANKPPGLAYIGTPAYFLVYHIESRLGIPHEAPAVVTANAHFLTFVTSGLPAAALVVLLYLHFRRREGTIREAMALAGAFGCGSLLLPYSGIMMNHALASCLLFAAWHSITAANSGRGPLLLGGLLTGMAFLTEFLTLPAGFLFLLYVARRRGGRGILWFVVGPTLMGSLLLRHNLVAFGSPLATNLSAQSAAFRDEALLFGMLGWPQPIRLFWLSVHPFRGLFYSCPVLFLPLLSIGSVPLRKISLEDFIPLSIFFYFLLFNLSFNGWTGGWCVGPRYLMPGLPFLFSYALPGLRRFPRLSPPLIALSAISMLSVTAVGVVVESPNSGAPPNRDPIAKSIHFVADGTMSVSVQSMLEYVPRISGNDAWDSYNLGEVAGLRRASSMLPIFAWLLVFTGVVLAQPNRYSWARRR